MACYWLMVENELPHFVVMVQCMSTPLQSVVPLCPWHFFRMLVIIDELGVL